MIFFLLARDATRFLALGIFYSFKVDYLLRTGTSGFDHGADFFLKPFENKGRFTQAALSLPVFLIKNVAFVSLLVLDMPIRSDDKTLLC